jgi:hypothetical protein
MMDVNPSCVPHDVLPDIQDRTARGVHERAAWLDSRAISPTVAKRGKNHHVIFPETVGAACVRQEPRRRAADR